VKSSTFSVSLKRKSFNLSAGPYSLALGQETRVMGIINATADSFSGDGIFHKTKDPIRRAIKLAIEQHREGADIIDIGGESTRPGAKPVFAQEEIKRVIPVLKALKKELKVPISVDTCKTLVAEQALDHGADIINNIQGTQVKKTFLKKISSYNAAIVLMHMRGTPRTMQKMTRYSNLIEEIKDELRKSVEICLESGIKSDRIVIDPGIGFAKTVEQNLNIIHCLSQFNTLKLPILIGTSRKSFIGKILNADVANRLYGTLATVCASIHNGAHIIRVHDVKPAKEAAVITDKILNPCLLTS
jgi:dihydropteroate synthase